VAADVPVKFDNSTSIYTADIKLCEKFETTAAAIIWIADCTRLHEVHFVNCDRKSMLKFRVVSITTFRDMAFWKVCKRL